MRVEAWGGRGCARGGWASARRALPPPDPRRRKRECKPSRRGYYWCNPLWSLESVVRAMEGFIIFAAGIIGLDLLAAAKGTNTRDGDDWIVHRDTI